MINSIHLYALNDKENIYNDLIKLYDILVKKNIIISAEEWMANFIYSQKGYRINSNPQSADAIITLGGDGTFLRVLDIAIKYDLPVMGINSGRLGFLTQCSIDNFEDKLIDLIKGNYNIVERNLLSASHNNIYYDVLNDVVISRAGYSRLVNLELLCDSKNMVSFFADGVVISTPTGSTGYNLSAGGPIVNSDVECMIITPICAHSLMSRTIVVNNNSLVTVKLKNETNFKSQLIIDGNTKANLLQGDEITICRSKKNIKLILFNNNFFDVLKEKFTEWK